MRKIFIVWLMTGAIGCSEECLETDKHKTSVYLFIDRTDSLNFARFKEGIQADVAQLKPVFKKEECHAGTLKIIQLGDIGIGTTKQISYSIPPGANKFDMPEVNNFLKKLPSFINEHTTTADSGLSSSHIFEPFCIGLLELAQADKGRKIVILYSDMIENSPVLDMYKNRNILSADSVRLQMENRSSCKLPQSLKGIEFYVIQHRTASTDTLIRNTARFWREIIQQRSGIIGYPATSLNLQ